MFPLVRLKKEGKVAADSVVERKKDEKGDATGTFVEADVGVAGFMLGVLAGAARELAGGNISVAKGESLRLTLLAESTESEVAGDAMEASDGALLAKKLDFLDDRNDPTLVASEEAREPASLTPANTALSISIAKRDSGPTYHA